MPMVNSDQYKRKEIPLFRNKGWGSRSNKEATVISVGLSLCVTANGDPSVPNCPQTDTEDDHPILRREVEAALQSSKKGKSAGVDNIPAELVQAGGEDVITALTTICNKMWQTACGQPHGPNP